MTTVEEALFKLSTGDRAFCAAIGDVRVGDSTDRLDAATTALMRLSALIAIGPADALLHESVSDALDAGVDAGAIVGALIEIAGTVGVNQLVAAAPSLALALGYDLLRPSESLELPASEPVLPIRKTMSGGV